MSHLVESMAFEKSETPWHGLGFPVDNDLTPIEMMQAAKVNWTVDKIPLTFDGSKGKVDTGHSALVRSSDESVLDVITNDWNPTQNEVAFEFFADFVKAGTMSMETAGSLDKGRVVWALAKINKSFQVVRNDVVEGYLLFSNPHKYGRAINVRFTPIRVVCNNTLTLALSTKVDEKMSISVNHRNAFDPDLVKETLGLADVKLDRYSKQAKFLTSKDFDDASVKAYLQRVFPSLSPDPKKAAAETTLSRPAQAVLEVLDSQPGAKFGKGSYWQLFNAISYSTDHLLGRSADSRLHSAWFGVNSNRKQRALDVAVEMAKAA